MGLRDLLKKKGGGDDDESDDETLQMYRQQQQQQQHQQQQKQKPPTSPRKAAPEITFIRSDTHTVELIHPPTGLVSAADEASAEASASDEDDGGNGSAQFLQAADGGRASRTRRSLDVFRSPTSRSVSPSSGASGASSRKGGGGGSSSAHRLSRRLRLSRPASRSSHVPADLPDIVPATGDNGEPESQWEKRATMLALENERAEEADDGGLASRQSRDRSRSTGRGAGPFPGSGSGSGPGIIITTTSGTTATATATAAAVSTKEVDATIQEAIRLHEAGRLEESTRMFGVLADRRGTNNPLSQVLYGLALRHGWGCQPDTEAAVRYLSAAASNAAAVESLALEAGLQKGGAAKGELVLAIFELANCFRHGWGIAKDPIAAKQYYETAANLGDTDAMNEVAWCYLEGFGCKKDKYASAKYYRLAEKNGNKTLGNTWIWKDKYEPGRQKK